MGSTHLPHPRRAPDHYRLLGVPEDALFRDIEQAYWREAKRNRDLLPQLNRAYEVLGDPQRRAEYDEQGLASAGQTSRPSPPEPQRSNPELRNKLRWYLH